MSRSSQGDPGLVSSRKTLKISDLFIQPDFNELKTISMDSHGAAKKLTWNQLDTIRQRGEFEVDSVQFSGQKHRWRLSQFLVKGKERATETLQIDLALALRLIGN